MTKQFQAWVETYQDDAWSLARYLLDDASEAEDATQEAFITLWKNRRKVDPEKIRAWLMKVVRNGCMDRLRVRRPQAPILAEAAASDEPEPGADGPAENVEQTQLGLQMRRAIAGLDEPYRTLVVLRDVHQHSYAEIAGVTDLSMDQVKVYLHRARRRLRVVLADVLAEGLERAPGSE